LAQITFQKTKAKQSKETVAAVGTTDIYGQECTTAAFKQQEIYGGWFGDI
jgi:hypothetical protein